MTIKAYLFSEILLVIKRWHLFVINVLYFTIPILFFQIIAMPIIDKNNQHLFDIISSGLFLVVFITVLQFFIFNRVISEYNSGIILNKFCLPLRNSILIICDLIAENIFGFILLILCFFVSLIFINTNIIVLICGFILIPSCITITHSFALLFFANTENIVIASVFSFMSLLPLLFFISNIVQEISVMQNIIMASLYSLFIVLIYISQTAFTVNNISL